MKRLGIASFVVGGVLAALFTVLLVMNLPGTPKPVDGGVVHLDDAGLKIYASQPGVEPTCEVKTATDGDVALEVPSGSETLTINGTSWYLVARSVDEVPAGDYVVNCVETEPGTTFAVGARGSLGVFVLAIVGLIVSVLIFATLGSILLATASRRTRKATPNNTFPNQAGHPQQPGYPQQPGSFPGYPPPGTYNPGPNPDRPQDGSPNS
ncbi:hypothetical protein [Kribbella sp. NPDC023855]|uniref:hypothetical protein n=1 Tax=Kribbella sp. NPDC023855 TaxID=3154698 RepID=UPI003403647E